MRDTTLLLLGLLLIPGSAVADEPRGAALEPARVERLSHQLADVETQQHALADRQAALARRVERAPEDLQPQLQLEVNRLAAQSKQLAERRAALEAQLAPSPPR